MKKVISMTLLLFLLLCSCSSMDLYDYALTMEDSSSFACTDGVIYKSLNRYTGSNENGSISLVGSKEYVGFAVRTRTSKTRAENMEPHEFIFATKHNAYIRNDGTIWCGSNFTGYSGNIEQFSSRSDTFPDEPQYDLSISITENFRNIRVTLTNTGEATLPSPGIHLFVQLADGAWYICSPSGNHNGAVYGIDYTSFPSINSSTLYPHESLLDIDIDMEQGETREYSFSFPKKGNSYIPGRYRIAVYSGLANEDTLYDAGKSYRTWPIADTAQPEAYVEFKLKKSVLKGFKLTNFESSVEAFTAK